MLMLTFINYFASSQQHNELTLKAENDLALSEAAAVGLK